MTAIDQPVGAPAPITSCWVLSDGKAGDETQCLGLAEALGLEPQPRRVAPGAPWLWLMPWGPIDPREAPHRPQSPIAPPFPDILIASGRRAAAYVRHVKRASAGHTFTVMLKDARAGTSVADVIWVPQHDRLRGENVLVSETAPHRVSQARLAAARLAPPAPIAALARPRAAVLIGGESRHFLYDRAAVRRLGDGLRALARQGVALIGTLSRRSALVAGLEQEIRSIFSESGGFLWDGRGENPYISLLANADLIVVTADSTNMVGEALAAGRPVYLFRPTPTRAGGRLAAFLAGLEARGAVLPFSAESLAGGVETAPQEPLDSTPLIAESIRLRYQQFRADRGPPA